jgi:hypothetical protein
MANFEECNSILTGALNLVSLTQLLKGQASSVVTMADVNGSTRPTLDLMNWQEP